MHIITTEYEVIIENTSAILALVNFCQHQYKLAPTIITMKQHTIPTMYNWRTNSFR